MHTTQLTLCSILLFGCGIIASASASATTQQHRNASETVVKSVQKRWIPRYTYNSEFALAVVVAIPLELKGRNVFCSWNVEANYYYPYFDHAQGLVPLPFATITDENTNLGTLVAGNDGGPFRRRNLNGDEPVIIPSKQSQEEADDENVTDEKTESDQPTTLNRDKRQILEHFLTRRRLYLIVESKLKEMGLNGRQCLLKSICEAAEIPVNTHNGVLGDIMHVVFTPSASRMERLPSTFYEAETRGHRHDCDVYARKCPRSILDLFSVFA